jgi:hypothetical protein
VQTSAALLNAAFFAPLLPLVPKPPKNYDFRTQRSGAWQIFTFAVTREEEALVLS